MDAHVSVDTAALDATTGELVLHLVEDGPWPTDFRQREVILKCIQDKILDVVDAAIDGGVAAVFPNSAGKNVRVQIDSPSGCPDDLVELIKNINAYLHHSDEYQLAIQSSSFISGLRVETGHALGRFRK